MGENVAAWVDHLLQPLVFQLPGFLKDTEHLVSIIEHTMWPPESGWLMYDGVGLYQSLPHNLSLQCLQNHLDRFAN